MRGHQSKSSILSAKRFRMPCVFPMREGGPKQMTFCQRKGIPCSAYFRLEKGLAEGDRKQMAPAESVSSVSEKGAYFRLEKGLAMKWLQVKASILSAKEYRMPCVFPIQLKASVLSAKCCRMSCVYSMREVHKEIAPVEGVLRSAKRCRMQCVFSVGEGDGNEKARVEDVNLVSERV